MRLRHAFGMVYSVAVMCGIVGIVRSNAPEIEQRSVVSRMAEHIAHRGPDGGGVVACGGATLGMTRLAIVDVEHGHQPMRSEDGAVCIVYNGEVYNAPELRRGLEERGHVFRTRSDTEVILRLYDEEPDNFERHLVGMWAIAVHDSRRQRVTLSRDRFGIKPLFIADTGGELAFASELRCFDKNRPGYRALFEIDPSAAHAMVSWSYVPESNTIYRGVRRLPPASRLNVDLTTGARAERVYWRLEPSPEAARIRTMSAACEAVDALLRRAVREHLESDVPVATFLSGGIDSSLVTAYAHELGKGPVKAYSIGFTEKRFDESTHAKATAEILGVPISVETFDEDRARAKLADALLAYDEPFGDSSSLATYLLCHHVARDYKVALGGDGGDEVFAGYKKYLVMKLRKPFSYVPSVRDAISLVLKRLPVRLDRTSRSSEVLRTVRRLARGLGGPDARVYADLTQVAPLFHSAPLMRHSASAEQFLEAAAQRFAMAQGSELQRTLACDLGSMLPNDMLVKVDRASMACSLEARVPFLDHRLVEFGVGLGEEFTLGQTPLGLRAFQDKRVLRELHERRFGPVLARREKMGFGVPVERWLRGPFDMACSRLFATKKLDEFGILSSEALGQGRYRQWLSHSPQLVWHAFALAAWCEANLGDGPEALRSLLARA